MKQKLAYQYIMNYCLNIWGKSTLKETRTTSTRRLWPLIAILLALSPPSYGSESVGTIPDGLPYFVMGMFAVTAIPEPDKQSHYYAGFMLGSAFTLIGEEKNPWVGFGVGCGAGLAKEIYDNGQEGNKFDDRDLAYTCAGAAISAYSTDSIIKYFAHRDGNKTYHGVRLQKRF